MDRKHLTADPKTHDEVLEIQVRAAKKYGRLITKKEIIRVAVQNLLAQPKAWEVWK